MSEQEVIAKGKRRNQKRLGFALLVAAMIVVAQVPPLNHWSGHNYVIWAAIGFVVADYVKLALGKRNPIYAALLVYTVAVLAGSIAEEAAHPPRNVMIAVAVGSVAAGVVALGLVAREGMRRNELDRYLFSEASSLAFFATMFTVVTFALLHQWLKIDAPDPFVFAAIGGGAWVVATIALRRRYT